MNALIFYLLTINTFGFCLMAVDKYNAIHHQWRIPESTLLLTAAVGGSVGALLGMKLRHHKTKKWYFSYGLPFFASIHCFLTLCWLLQRLF